MQTAFQARKASVDAYGLWVFNPSMQLRVTASNVGPRDYLTGGSLVDTGAGVSETSQTTTPTYLNLQVRLEIKL